jgi:drug/metabolite transporter (DMT)-like permease
MRRFYAIGFLLLLSFDTVTQLSLKAVGSRALPLEFSAAWLVRVLSEPWLIAAVLGYLGSFFTWMTLLKHAPIGPAFAASHLEIVTVMLASALLFDERLHWSQGVGALLILGGIALLAKNDGADERTDASVTACAQRDPAPPSIIG